MTMEFFLVIEAEVGFVLNHQIEYSNWNEMFLCLEQREKNDYF